MKKFTIKIEGKEYEIELQEEFAKYMEKELEKNLPKWQNNAIKDLLGAYLKKCFECYTLEQKVEKLLKKFEIQ